MRHPSNCFPYFWQYAMSNENIFANTGQWTCARLAGRTARFAAGTGASPPGPLNSKPRKFALVVSDIGEGEGDPTSTPTVYGRLLSELQSCGIQIAREHMLVNPVDPTSYTAALTRMQQDGVTSVMCMAVFGTCILGQKYADNLPYFPEWISSSYSGVDSD